MSYHSLSQYEILVSAALVCLILIIQLLHYPFFHFVNEAGFDKAMEFHQKRISWIVVPLMLLEAGLMMLQIYLENFSYARSLAFLFLLIVWGATFFYQVPLHNTLLLKKDTKRIEALVKTNWIRTIAWSLKLLALVLMNHTRFNGTGQLRNIIGQ